MSAVAVAPPRGGADEAFFAALAQPGIRGLRAYDPGHDLVALRRRFADAQLVELGSNENPCGPSPRARAAVLATLDDLYRYPDPRGGDLKAALAEKHGLDASQLLLGNGTHELLMQFAQVFAGPDAGVVASDWTPAASLAAPDGTMPAPVLWTALDCPAGIAWTHRLPDAPPMMTVRIAARVDAPVHAGERCVVMGWPIARDGRKLHAGTAIVDDRGVVRARSLQLWLLPRG